MLKRSFATLFILFTLSLTGLQSCGPKAFTKGQYADPENVILLDDKFNENDMQLIAKTLVESLTEFERVKSFEGRPVVMLTKVGNRTSEHIDVKMLTDKIRTSLIKSGRFRFSDKATRDELKEEYDYQSSEYVDAKTAAKKGRQLGADFIINGDIGSNIQQVGRDKVVYYKVTLNLVDVETNIIEWSDEREVRKIYKKRTISN